MTIKASLLPSALGQFTGTFQYHKLTMHPRVLFTDGMAHLAKEAQCYWLMDVIMSHLVTNKKVAKEGFVSFTITVDENKKAVCKFTDGNDHKLCAQIIESTNFPFATFNCFCQRDESNGGLKWIVMLPSEY